MARTATPNTTPMPPCSIPAESAVLGSLLLDPSAMLDISIFLKPEHFYRDNHRVIYQRMIDLHDHGSATDIVSLSDELALHHELEAIGDDYLLSLVNTVPTSANVKDYAKRVVAKARDRKVLALVSKAAAMIYDGQSDEALALMTLDSMRLTEMTSDEGDLLISHHAALDAAEALMRENILGVAPQFKTYYPVIDNWLPPLRRSWLVIIAALPSVGKTSLARTIALRNAEHGQKVLYLTMEMTEVEQAEASIATTAYKVDHADLSYGGNVPADSVLTLDTVMIARGFNRGQAWMDLELAEKSIAWQHKHIADNLWWCRRIVSTAQFDAIVKMAKQMYGIDMVIVDQAPLFDNESKTNDTERQNAIAKSMKQTAQRHDVLIIGLTQLRMDNDRKTTERPNESKIKQSKGYYEHANVVGLLHRPEQDFPARGGLNPDHPMYVNWAEFIGVKARSAAKTCNVPLYFEHESSSFKDWPDHLPGCGVLEMREVVAKRESEGNTI